MGDVTEDLVAFLKARLDEDEAAARAAAEGPWKLKNSDDDPYWDGGSWDFGKNASARRNVVRHWHIEGPNVHIESATNDAHFVPDLKHIARHDPARVLREVEAMRKMVKRGTEARWLADGDRKARAENGPDWAPGLEFSVQRERIYFETILPYLAEVWSDHPDYRAEWKP